MTHQYTYDYPRAALTVDCAVFGLDDEGLKVLLIQRDAEPFAGCWALPGGYVEMDESLDAAARRELEEETGVRPRFLEQLRAFGAVHRDPRGRVVTVAYYGLVRLADHRLRAASDARDARWHPVDQPLRLAFDHAEILGVARERLRSAVCYQPLARELLPDKFTLRRLQQLYETVLGHTLDKRSFRKKILSLDLLTELDQWESGVAHRAARLYRFTRRRGGAAGPRRPRC
ncbi:MAG: NUDIX hydrolase [Planctomycetaceae bacterium]|nr:NUDIX hydrolase [Planctomycetaceae bacterium]